MLQEVNTTKQLDQFYTKQEVAKACTNEYLSVLRKLKRMNASAYHFIEPSAGYGCFMKELQERNIKVSAYDIDPKSKNINKKDFLKQKIRLNSQRNKRVVIGNPPFGRRGNTAVQFIKKAYDYADVIGFILPRQFSKYITQKQLPQDLALVYESSLPANSFYTREFESVDIGCVFQVWTSLKTSLKNKRILQAPQITHPDFVLYQYNNTQQALKYFEEKFDVAIFNQGYGQYPLIKHRSQDCNKKKQWLLVKAKNKRVLQRIKKMDYQKLAQSNTTVPGFRKADFVKEYMALKASV